MNPISHSQEFQNNNSKFQAKAPEQSTNSWNQAHSYSNQQISSGSGSSEERPQKLHSIFLSHLPNKTSQRDIIKLYKKYGKVESLEMWNKKKQEFSTYAILKTKSPTLLNFLLTNDQFIGTVKFYARRYFSAEEKELYQEDLKKRRLLALNIDPLWSDTEFQEFMSQFYEIEKAYAMRKNTKRSLGFGYVIFSKYPQAEQALFSQKQKASSPVVLATDMSSEESSQEQKNNSELTHKKVKESAPGNLETTPGKKSRK